MNSNELTTYLEPYIGRKVRIGSAISTSMFKIADYPTLNKVTAKDEVHTRVIVEFEGGLAYAVDDDALIIELPPAVGTFDFALPKDRMEAIGTALRRHGPTEKELRKRCHCITCKTNYVELDTKAKEEFQDAWNHGPTDPELDLLGW